MFCRNPHCSGAKEFELTDQEKRIIFDYNLTAEELVFCPQCRELRRLAFRNERNLFKRKCDQSGKEIWSIYHPDSPVKVYDKDIWWSDSWDGLSYGQDIDFSRPFFQQFYELMLKVPRSSLVQSKNNNSDYCNDANGSNDCYMIFTADGNVNCHYGSFIESKDSIDCEDLNQSELCYDCVYCNNCHSTIGSEFCVDSSNVYFSSNLVNCHYCIFSFGLRDKKYCIFNTEVSPDVFMNFILQRQLFRRKNYQKAKEMFAMFLETVPQRYMYLLKTENSTGDRLINCKDCENSYAVQDAVACSNMGGQSGVGIKDCMDGWSVVFGAEKCFEAQTSLRGGMNFVANFLSNCTSCFYSDLCHNCQDCFGCIGLKNKQYCILNKQYSPEEYKVLKEKLIVHMKQTQEWGQFFPLWASPFAYNTTVADLYYPYDKNQYLESLEVSKKLWPPSPMFKESSLWLDKKPKNDQGQLAISPPDSLFEAKNSEILSTTYFDVETGDPFLITGRELALYQKLKVPLPDKSFNSRYRERIKRYNQRKLYQRKCQKCNKDFATTFAPESPHIVFCEECFLNSLQ